MRAGYGYSLFAKKNDEGDDASVIIGVTCFKVGMFSKLLSRHTSGGPAARPPSPSPFSHWFTRFAERLAGLRGRFQGCWELLGCCPAFCTRHGKSGSAPEALHFPGCGGNHVQEDTL